MPIFVELEEVEPPEPPTPEDPTPPSTPDPVREGLRSWLLIDSTGVQLPFLPYPDYGYMLLPGMTGHGISTVNLASDPLPADHGSLFRNLRVGERDIFLPIWILGPDPGTVTDYRRALEHLVSPLRGTVQVQVRHPAGEWRTCTGYYVGGAEGDLGRDAQGRDFEIFGITIRCLDPWWYAPTQTQSWRLTSSSDPFLSDTDPFFPITLGASGVVGSAIVTNGGDVPAEPIWTITGPGSAVVVTNTTTGQSWTYDAAIAAGDSIRVDTRRTQQTVVDVDTGTNLFANLGPNPSLWQLQPGINNVVVGMTGADADSRVQLSWAPRYLTSG